MNKPHTHIACVSNIFSKMMHFAFAGDVMDGHKHSHDHLTLLAMGSVKVTVDGRHTTFTAPQMIYIQAGKEHKLEALADNSLAFCIHAIRDGDSVGDILDPSMIPEGIEWKDYITELNAKPLIKD